MVRIDGWKGIADVLGVSVPTAQRLRLRCGLPVVNVSARLVCSTREALDAWRRDHDATLTRRVAGACGAAVGGVGT